MALRPLTAAPAEPSFPLESQPSSPTHLGVIDKKWLYVTPGVLRGSFPPWSLKLFNVTSGTDHSSSTRYRFVER